MGFRVRARVRVRVRVRVRWLKASYRRGLLWLQAGYYGCRPAAR